MSDERLVSEEILKEQPKILKLTEMALSISDQNGSNYIGEAGNRSYEPRELIAVEQTAEGEQVVLIEGKKEYGKEAPTWELKKDDLVQLGNFGGYVKVEDFFEGWEPGMYNDRELVGKFYEKETEVQDKLGYIKTLANTLGVHHMPSDFDQSVWALTRNPDTKRYSSKELLASYTQTILDKVKREKKYPQEKIDDIRTALENMGLYTKKPEEFIVPFYYLYASVKEVDGNNVADIENSLRNFVYLDKLLEKFSKNPDATFGDNLLGALSRVKREQNLEEEHA